MASKDIKIEKTVYLVRHGQSEGNVSPVFQATNSPLSEHGLRQAKEIAKRTSNLSFETLIASPLQRAKQTAEAISEETGKEIEFQELFVERVKPTAINGKPFTDKKADEIWRAWEKSLVTPGMRSEDGENYNDLVARADKALSFLGDRNEDSLVVVSHGYFLRTVVARVILGETLTGDTFKAFQKSVSMENTGLTVLQYYANFEEEAKWHLKIYNDHAHLG